jgi:glycosyltransferase involved in cell wall biosynthesis
LAHPRLVAIVPAFGAGGTLRRTLDALLQDNRGFVDEVIVVVSGDDDRAVGIVAGYGRAMLVRCEDRLSAGAARNLGRRCAPTAARLLFVDADCAPAAGCVARMIAAAARTGAAAVSATVKGAGAGMIGWLRHVLEFKDAERGVGVVSATLLCDPDAFDAAGGFPDMWPGEDLVLCERLGRDGRTILRIDEAVTIHLHPGGWRPFLEHQYRLGRTSAVARAMTRMSGAGFVQQRWLTALLPVGRAVRAAVWLARHEPRGLPLFILALPLYVAGLMSWTVGFSRASRQCS